MRRVGCGVARTQQYAHEVVVALAFATPVAGQLVLSGGKVEAARGKARVGLVVGIGVRGAAVVADIQGARPAVARGVADDPLVEVAVEELPAAVLSHLEACGVGQCRHGVVDYRRVDDGAYHAGALPAGGVDAVEPGAPQEAVGVAAAVGQCHGVVGGGAERHPDRLVAAEGDGVAEGDGLPGVLVARGEGDRPAGNRVRGRTLVDGVVVGGAFVHVELYGRQLAVGAYGRGRQHNAPGGG